MIEKLKDKDAERKRQDEDLDEALEESFPASDPPAQTQPRDHADRNKRPKT